MDYDKLIAPAAKAMRPSGIRKFFDLAAEMPECISLGVGEPDFKTPWAVREAGIESLEHGRTRYTSNAGLKELRAEISRYLERRMNLRYDPMRPGALLCVLRAHYHPVRRCAGARCLPSGGRVPSARRGAEGSHHPQDQAGHHALPQ